MKLVTRHWARRFWMNPLKSVLFAICLAGQSGLSFVSNVDEFGQVRRWPLETPHPSISTNVINPATRAIRYFLRVDGYSRTNTTAELDAIRSCLGQWESVPGTSLKFEDAGVVSPDTDVNTADQTNVVFWAKESTWVNGGKDNIFGTLAITFPRLTNNVLLEADVVLNGTQFSWIANLDTTNNVDQFIEASALREIGHFLGLDHSPVGGVTNVQNLSVSAGNPTFRITRIARPDRTVDDLAAINAPVSIRLGESNLAVGVYSPGLTSEATLSCTGSGITLGPSTFVRDAFPGSNPSLNLVSASITIASNALPGLRSLVVRQGNHIAIASGFLEIVPRFRDDNFDGLDDAFQRRFFPVFTMLSAGPKADPDSDGFNNANEFVAGSSPIDGRSLLKIEQLEATRMGTTITWQSEPGKRYRLLSRPQLGVGEWSPVGGVIAATTRSTTYVDNSASGAFRFYQIQLLYE